MPVETHEDIMPAHGMEADGVSTHHDIKLAHGIEAADERVERAYGGVVPGPKFDKDEPEQYGRRLIEWAFAAAPIVARGHTPSFAGQWKYSNIHMRNEGGRVGSTEARMDEEVKAGNPDHSVYNSSQRLSSDGDRYRSPSDDFDIEEIKNRAGKYYGGGMGGFKGFSPGFKGSRSRFTTSPTPQQPNEINMQESTNRTETGLLRPPVDPAVSRGSIPRLPDYVQGFSGGYPTASPQQPLPTGRPSGYPTGGIFDVWGPMFASAMGSFYSGLGGGYRGFADGGAVDDEEQRQLTPMGFYSAAAEAASTIPQRAPIDQILNKIKGSPNVKAEELDWSGVRDAFAGQKSVDPKEVAQHLQANLPQIQEKIYGYDSSTKRKTLRRPRYEDYTTPGGNNYREILLHLPQDENKDERDNIKNEIIRNEAKARLISTSINPPRGYVQPDESEVERHKSDLNDVMTQLSQLKDRLGQLGPEKPDYQSGHWGERVGSPAVKNILAHLRLTDRGVQRFGSPESLHIEEVQSDWGQSKRDDKRVPDGPHIGSTEGWTDLALKRALLEAARGRYKRLTWTPGEEQAERYGLDKSFSQIHYSPDTKHLFAIGKDDVDDIDVDVHEGALSGFIGKELAEKLLARPAMDNTHPFVKGDTVRSLIGGELAVPQKGMRDFYDRMIPNRLQKLVSKLDPEAKVQLYGHKIDVPGENYPSDANDWKGDEDDWELKKVHSLEITPKLRAAILKGLPAYEQGGSVDRTKLHYKDVTKRIPQLTESAASGVGGSEYQELVNIHKPVQVWNHVPAAASFEEMHNALEPRKREKLGKDADIPEGHPVGLRLDIPAYRDHGVWIPTIHDRSGGSNTVLAHAPHARVYNATFNIPQKKAEAVAKGGPKSPFATIDGSWKPTSVDDAQSMAEAYLNHPEWRQVGMDPERHSYFYDRETQDPITHAEEVLQIGPLVLAKNPRYGNREDYSYEYGGSVVDRAFEVLSRLPR